MAEKQLWAIKNMYVDEYWRNAPPVWSNEPPTVMTFKSKEEAYQYAIIQRRKIPCCAGESKVVPYTPGKDKEKELPFIPNEKFQIKKK